MMSCTPKDEVKKVKLKILETHLDGDAFEGNVVVAVDGDASQDDARPTCASTMLRRLLEDLKPNLRMSWKRMLAWATSWQWWPSA